MGQPIVNVLLVEDSEDGAILTRKLLAASKTVTFVVDWIRSCQAAVETILAERYDVCLIDCHENGTPGLELLGAAVRRGCKIPLVILTGPDDADVDREAIRTGAADHLIKDKADPEMLERVICHALERQRAQLALSQEQQRLRTLIDNLPDAIYFKDINSRFVINNATHLRILGAASQEGVLGKWDFDVFPHDLAARYYADEQQVVQSGEALINREELVVDPQQQTHWFLTSKVPLRGPDGTVVGLVGVSRNITALKEAEAALRRAHDELDQRVRDRTAELSKVVGELEQEIAERKRVEDELRDAIGRLQRHDQAKSEFVSNVSHELKTPLTSMLYGMRNLLKGLAGPLPEEVVRYLRMFDKECQRLVNTINTILDLGKIDSRDFVLSTVRIPLARLVARCVESLRLQAEAGRIAMRVSLNKQAGFVNCDPEMIERVVHNILGNAIKFTQAGGTVDVRVGRDSAEGRQAVLEVEDTGIGIPPEALGRVTERYFRAEHHSSGSGLGLAIAKEAVELHGGRLAVKSPPPGRQCGTVVTVKLPAADPLTVLIVDDDSRCLDLLTDQLGTYSYRVVRSVNASEALANIEAHRPDAMILDLVLSDMHGCDLILALKSSAKVRNMPILVVTGANVDEARLEVLTRFAVPLLSKPWQEAELLETFESALMGMRVFQKPKRSLPGGAS